MRRTRSPRVALRLPLTSAPANQFTLAPCPVAGGGQQLDRQPEDAQRRRARRALRHRRRGVPRGVWCRRRHGGRRHVSPLPRRYRSPLRRSRARRPRRAAQGARHRALSLAHHLPPSHTTPTPAHPHTHIHPTPSHHLSPLPFPSPPTISRDLPPPRAISHHLPPPSPAISDHRFPPVSPAISLTPRPVTALGAGAGLPTQPAQRRALLGPAASADGARRR